MKYQVLIDILFLLLSRDKVSAKYIAEKFDISLRTVYRYIDELSIPVPIYNIRGRNGGFSISDTFKLPASFLTDEEKEFLLGCLKGMDKEINSETLKRVIDKISVITKNKNDSEPINFGNLIIDGGPWGNADTYKETLTLIEKCIERCLVLTISYRDGKGSSTERNIEPHTILLKQGLWYCYAYCNLRKCFRLFKIGRISSARVTEKVFKRREIKDIDKVLNEWYSNLKTIDVELDVDDSIKPDVEEWLGVDKVYSMPSGVTRASARLPLNKDLTAKILSFGNKIKVIAPQELKNEIIDTANAISKLYN